MECILEYGDTETVSDLGTDVFHEREKKGIFARAGANEDDPSSPKSSKVDINVVRNHFHSLPLKGRSEEILFLRSAFDRVLDEHNSEVVFVEGQAGAGKSVYVESLRNHATDKSGWFVAGKFDQCQTVPYSALAEALSDLIDLLQQHDDHEKVRSQLAGHLRPRDVRTLSVLIPNIREFMQVPEKDVSESRTEITSPSVLQLQLALRRFLHIVARPCHPIVLFFDDLHFAEDDSVDVVESLLADEMSRSLLIVCSYRANEFDSSRLECHLDKHIVSMRALTVADVKGVILEVFPRCAGNATDLAEVVHRKTHGNAYSVTEFIELLFEKGFLEVNSDRTLTWNLNLILDATDVADSVAELLKGKIRRLSSPCQMVLQIAAACLGHRFYVPLLELVVTAAGLPRNAYKKALQIAEYECLIERFGGGAFAKFSHDKIQQAASDTIEEEGRERLHLNVGRIVLSSLEQFGNAMKVNLKLLAAQNMSVASDSLTSDKEKIALVVLNLEAAKLLRSRCAYAKAAGLLRVASTIAPETMWRHEHYETAVDLFSTLAELEVALCKHDRCRSAIKMVKQHASSQDDKLRVYMTDVKNYIAESRFEDAIEAAGVYIRALGVRFPSKVSKLSLAAEVIRTKLRLRGRSDEDIRALPTMTDKSVLHIMELLNNIVVSGYWISDHDIITLAGLRMLQETLVHGLSSEGLYGLGVFAIVESSLQRIGSAKRYGILACSLWPEVRCPSSSVESRFRSGVTQLVTHLFTPLPECLLEYKIAHTAAMDAADYFNAFSAILGETSCNLYCKEKPLYAITEDLDNACKQYESFGVTYQIVTICYLWQFMLNVSDCGEGNPTNMQGGYAIDKIDEYNPNEEMTKTLKTYQVLNKFIICYYFESWDYIREKMSEYEKIIGATFTVTQPSVYQTQLIMVLAALRIYEQTGKRRYLRAARGSMKVLSKLHGKQCPNARSPLLIASAEFARVVPAQKLTVAALEAKLLAALAEAKKASWFDHYVVLERLVDLFYGKDDFVLARSYLDDLFDVCDEWGAFALGSHLEEKYYAILH